MSWTLDPKYTPASVRWAKSAPSVLGETLMAARGQPVQKGAITPQIRTLSERIASKIIPEGRGWTDLRNKVQGAIDAVTPLGAEQPLRDARTAYQGGNYLGAAGLGALAMLGTIPGPPKAEAKAARGGGL